ncbi:Pre-rRNA-processing protein TSR1 isoform 1 [Hibiscus syriacus]|uniref:Pre-rRNA-processing protein TSR1 isoform 1 n=1 Tax=Hibiscus syriacus TaxID=106335 RepID=A0A6A2WB43_HIBSY|nr:Pre-rRNA-processing protein TSR1 isoform 1 [Hibiscus syriacus]
MQGGENKVPDGVSTLDNCKHVVVRVEVPLDYVHKEGKVEIVSKGLIKPSRPTPHHLRTHMLSFKDQFLPPIYVPMVLFYMNQETTISSADIIANNSGRAQLLKESLFETLTLFYPFAGRIKDHFPIDCNDEGAYYVEARVNRPLCEFLELADSSYVPRLLPAEFSWSTPSAEGYVAMIQVTTFACGGIVIGACISHMIADATSVTTFLRSWAAMTRKSGEETACPNFDASFVFPQNVAYPREETLSAPFLKKNNMAVPPIPKHWMGNFLCAAMVITNETKLDKLVCHLRKTIRKVDGDIVTALQGDGGWLKFYEHIKEIGKASCAEAGEIDAIRFTSWCNFDLYEIDFGWGKPTWVTSTASTESETVFNDTVLLMDTKIGKGVEALVYVDE